MAGIIGGEAQSIARNLFQQHQRDWNAQQERERLRKEAEENPSGFAEQWLTKEQQADQTRTTQELQDQYRNEGREGARSVVARWQETSLSEEARAAIRDKVYNGMTWEDGFQAYLGDAVTAEVGVREKALRTRLERELRPVIEAEVRQGIAGGRPPIDGGGGTPAGGVISQSVFDANRGNMDWVQANFEQISRSMTAGAITR